MSKVVCLRRLSVFKLDATDGLDTYETAREVFEASFRRNFKKFGILFAGVAPEIEVASDELICNGKFYDFLGNTADELEKRRLLGSQFLKLCREHPEKLRRGRRFANFVVLTRNDEEVTHDLSNVFVARVCAYRDQLHANADPLSHSRIWRGDFGRHVFSRQQ